MTKQPKPTSVATLIILPEGQYAVRVESDLTGISRLELQKMSAVLRSWIAAMEDTLDNRLQGHTQQPPGEVGEADSGTSQPNSN